MRTVAGVTAVLLVGALLGGCSIDFSAQDLPEGEPDIRGVVTSYDPGVPPTDLDAEPTAENYPSMRVIWTDDITVGAEADYDAAQVQTDGPTLFFKKTDGAYIGLEDFEELKVGSVVEVWFRGAVMESYPVQATAASVVVAGSYDGVLPTVPGLEP